MRSSNFMICFFYSRREYATRKLHSYLHNYIVFIYTEYGFTYFINLTLRSLNSIHNIFHTEFKIQNFVTTS
jgi:hypothetical protein